MAISILPPTAVGYGYALEGPGAQRHAAGQAEERSTAAELGPLEQGQAKVDQAGQRPVDPTADAKPGDNPTWDRQGQGAETTAQAGDRLKSASRALADDLPPEQEAQVRELKQRDREVRNHEQAHIAAGGRFVNGGARYQYQTGPDGKRYAVGGEVSIDTSEASSPEASITKAQAIRRAALAPAQPSSQDRAVAAQAGQMEREARAELAAEKQEQADRAGEQQAAKAGAGGQNLAAQAQARPSEASAPPPIEARLKPVSITV